jgi:hypothetical protein
MKEVKVVEIRRSNEPDIETIITVSDVSFKSKNIDYNIHSSFNGVNIVTNVTITYNYDTNIL